VIDVEKKKKSHRYCANYADMKRIFKATDTQIEDALKILEGENVNEKMVVAAANRDYFTLRNATYDLFVGMLVNAVHRYQRFLATKDDWTKPNGNPVRDRLLEVGKYNPFSPDYVGDVIERREYPKHSPRFRTWGDI
jgi:hypothetical protein